MAQAGSHYVKVTLFDDEGNPIVDDKGNPIFDRIIDVLQQVVTTDAFQDYIRGARRACRNMSVAGMPDRGTDLTPNQSYWWRAAVKFALERLVIDGFVRAMVPGSDEFLPLLIPAENPNVDPGQFLLHKWVGRGGQLHLPKVRDGPVVFHINFMLDHNTDKYDYFNIRKVTWNPHVHLTAASETRLRAAVAAVNNNNNNNDNGLLVANAEAEVLPVVLPAPQQAPAIGPAQAPAIGHLHLYLQVQGAPFVVDARAAINGNGEPGANLLDLPVLVEQAPPPPVVEGMDAPGVVGVPPPQDPAEAIVAPDHGDEFEEEADGDEYDAAVTMWDDEPQGDDVLPGDDEPQGDEGPPVPAVFAEGEEEPPMAPPAEADQHLAAAAAAAAAPAVVAQAYEGPPVSPAADPRALVRAQPGADPQPARTDQFNADALGHNAASFRQGATAARAARNDEGGFAQPEEVTRPDSTAGTVTGGTSFDVSDDGNRKVAASISGNGKLSDVAYGGVDAYDDDDDDDDDFHSTGTKLPNGEDLCIIDGTDDDEDDDNSDATACSEDSEFKFARPPKANQGDQLLQLGVPQSSVTSKVAKGAGLRIGGDEIVIPQSVRGTGSTKADEQAAANAIPSATGASSVLSQGANVDHSTVLTTIDGHADNVGAALNTNKSSAEAHVTTGQGTRKTSAVRAQAANAPDAAQRAGFPAAVEPARTNPSIEGTLRMTLTEGHSDFSIAGLATKENAAVNKRTAPTGAHSVDTGKSTDEDAAANTSKVSTGAFMDATSAARARAVKTPMAAQKRALTTPTCTSTPSKKRHTTINVNEHGLKTAANMGVQAQAGTPTWTPIEKAGAASEGHAVASSHGMVGPSKELARKDDEWIRKTYRTLEYARDAEGDFPLDAASVREICEYWKQVNDVAGPAVMKVEGVPVMLIESPVNVCGPRGDYDVFLNETSLAKEVANGKSLFLGVLSDMFGLCFLLLRSARDPSSVLLLRGPQDTPNRALRDECKKFFGTEHLTVLAELVEVFHRMPPYAIVDDKTICSYSNPREDPHLEEVAKMVSSVSAFVTVQEMTTTWGCAFGPNTSSSKVVALTPSESGKATLLRIRGESRPWIVSLPKAYQKPGTLLSNTKRAELNATFDGFYPSGDADADDENTD